LTETVNTCRVAVYSVVFRAFVDTHMQASYVRPSIPMGIGKFQPPQNRHPGPIDKKFGTVDYVHERTPLYQILYRSTYWGLLCKWVKNNKNYLYLFMYTIFLWLTYRSARPVDGFLRAIAQKTWNQTSMCHFGIVRLTFNIQPLFIPQTVKIWPKTGQFLRLKTLNDE